MTGTTTEPRAPHKFEEGRELGAGGVGYVREGWIWRKGIKRECAIKRLHPNKRDVMHYDRFKREALISIQLTPGHPNLVTVESYGFDDQGPYLIMERIHGATAHHARRLIRGNWPVIWEIARATALAVNYLHERGFIHRDVTARNILLDRSGAIKLADLGLARTEDGTHTAGFHGTPVYSAPERLSRCPATSAADVYSLGAVLWHLAAGEPPYGTGDRSIVLMRMVEPPVRLPDDTPPALAALLTRMIDLGPNNRPSLAEALAIVDDHCSPDSGPIAADIARIATNPSAAYSVDDHGAVDGTTRKAGDSHQLLQIRERWRARMERDFAAGFGGISPALHRHLLLSVGRHFRATILDHLPRPAQSPHGTGPHLVVRPTGQWTDISDDLSNSSSGPDAELSSAEPQRLIETIRSLPEPYRSRAIAFLSDVASDVEDNQELFEALAGGPLPEAVAEGAGNEGSADFDDLLRIVFGPFGPVPGGSEEASDDDIGAEADRAQWDEAERQGARDLLSAMSAVIARMDAKSDGPELQGTPHAIARLHWGDGSASACELSAGDDITPPASSSDDIAGAPNIPRHTPVRRRRWVWIASFALAGSLLVGGYLAYDRASDRLSPEPTKAERAHESPPLPRPSPPPGPSQLTVERPELSPLSVQEHERPTAAEDASRAPRAWQLNRVRMF